MINYTKKNQNNDTYEQTIARLDWCFAQQSSNNPYPNVSWLFGSDWGVGMSVMSQEDFKAYCYQRADDMYSE